MFPLVSSMAELLAFLSHDFTPDASCLPGWQSCSLVVWKGPGLRWSRSVPVVNPTLRPWLSSTSPTWVGPGRHEPLHCSSVLTGKELANAMPVDVSQACGHPTVLLHGQETIFSSQKKPEVPACTDLAENGVLLAAHGRGQMVCLSPLQGCTGGHTETHAQGGSGAAGLAVPSSGP